MAAVLIGQPDPTVTLRHQEVRTARSHPSGPGLNPLAQGGITREPQLDHWQDTSTPEADAWLPMRSTDG